MTDDIVIRLREELLGFHQHLSQWEINAERDEAADEIERLRKALALAVGELSTHAQYQYLSPEQLLNQFLTEAVRDE